MSHVFFLPKLNKNLLSLGQFQERGLTVLFKLRNCKVYHRERGLIFESRMESNRMFKLIAPTSLEKTHSEGDCLYTSNEDVFSLWHCRYRHLSLKRLKLLKNKEMVRGLPKLSSEIKVCADCMKGKQHRNSIPKKIQW